jgi:hypothetical protein
VNLRRIAWASWHTSLPAQLREIARLFPGATLVDAGAHSRNERELIARLDELGADATIVVLPLSTIARARGGRGTFSCWPQGSIRALCAGSVELYTHDRHRVNVNLVPR